MGKIKLPDDPKDWSRSDFAEAMRIYLVTEARTREIEARLDQKILALRKEANNDIDQYNILIRSNKKRLKIAFDALCKNDQRRIETKYGVARLRTPPAKIKRNKGVTDDDVIAAAGRLRLTAKVVRTKQEINIEVIERLDPDQQIALGYHWTSPKDKFEIVPKE